MPPSPSILIISYWLIRTPGCGAALCAWTPVDAPSNVSHELLLGPIDGATEEDFARAGGRGCAWSVAAGTGAGTGTGPGAGAVPLAITPWLGRQRLVGQRQRRPPGARDDGCGHRDARGRAWLALDRRRRGDADDRLA